MAHQRQTIREAVATMLSGVSASIFTNRRTRLWSTELPAVLIYFLGDDEAKPRALNSSQYIRTSTLSIEIRIQDTDDVDDDLDTLALAIETIIHANYSLSSTAQSCVYKNTEIRLDTEGEYTTGVAVISYTVSYIL